MSETSTQVSIGTITQLFFDDHVIESLDGVQCRHHVVDSQAKRLTQLPYKVTPEAA